ncbi:MAG: ATP-grasp domain-containing protein [Syntrophales bacterium]
MKIGFTYDLRRDYINRGFTEEETAEFDSDETVHIITETLAGLGHEVIRIGGIFELVDRLSSGETWDLVFNISEGLYGRSREAQIPAVLEAYNIPYTFSDPLTLALCLDKAMTKTVVMHSGIPTPDFFTVKSQNELEDAIRQKELDFPLFIKPVAEGTGKGVTPDSIVKSRTELKERCTAMLARYMQPVIVEKYLPGREFTVGILGSGDHARAVGVLEVKLLKSAEPLVYSYLNKEFCEERVKYILVEDRNIIQEASKISLAAYRVLGCRDAGRVDLKTDHNGELYFLEMNPLAGLHPTHSDLPILCHKMGMPYSSLLSEILKSAAERGGISDIGRRRAQGVFMI